jgi:serine/threonine protein kinase
LARQLHETTLLFNCHFSQVFYGKFGDVDVAIKSAKSLSAFSINPTPTLNRKVDDKTTQSNAVQKSLINGLLREARLFANLHHHNIIQLYGVSPCLTEQNLYLVMEYAYGGALNQLLQQRQCGLYPQVFIHYARQIADGMKYLHDDVCEHIIHRDLKCSNSKRRRIAMKTMATTDLSVRSSFDRRRNRSYS